MTWECPVCGEDEASAAGHLAVSDECRKYLNGKLEKRLSEGGIDREVTSG